MIASLRFSILLIFQLLLLLALVPHAVGQEKGNRAIGNVTIFIYHKFGEDKYPTTNVSLDRFSEQLRYLKENGYSVVQLKQVVSILERGGAMPEKTAVITIDDGYTSTYSNAWPLLRDYGYPFTVFLYVKAVDQGYRNFLTWDQVHEMQKEGVDFQDHGYSHHRFGDVPDGMDDAAYRDWISADMRKGSLILEKNLGYRPEFMALPYGEYNDVVLRAAKDLGYKAVFSQDPGSVSTFTDIYTIPREPILGTDWSTLEHFAKVLSRKDLPIDDVMPPIEPLVELKPNKFCAAIVNPELYRLESFGIYVSELGWTKGTLIDNRLCIENKATLERRSNRVAISAQEKEGGATAMRYWLLIRK